MQLLGRRIGALWLQLAVSLCQGSGFEVYWNVPSFMCRKYQIDFTGLEQRWGIRQNAGDEFVGERMAILYDPGAFPALLQAGGANESRVLVRNGGVPQEGDLELHLREFRRQVERQLPDDRAFAGLGVIDMESWRPIFRQNWASLQLYRNYSLELELRRRPDWPAAKLRREATRRFEAAARQFMQRTLRLAEELRPRGRWGYYAYPYCFNWSANQQSSRCAPQVQQENDQMRWLFGEASVLYPSVYLQQKLSPEQREGMVRGRLREALRLAGAASPRPAQVFAYLWFKYQDQRDSYVDERQLTETLRQIANSGADGLIVWGSSNDLDSRTKCQQFQRYLQQTLGPALRNIS